MKAVSKWPSRQEQLSILFGQILSPGAKLSSQLLGAGAKLASQIKKKSEGEEAKQRVESAGCEIVERKSQSMIRKLDSAI